ncbi:MAG: cyclase family protein [Ignavibacteria bacterium]|nr:cyclase family protein [Ignavibacteria bacterium]
MKINFTIDGKVFSCDTSEPIDISIPIIFNGEQPNTYDVDKAAAKAVETAEFVGDTRRGGSCNFEEYKLIPHCNGTHTECVGHISLERISIHNTLSDSFIPATFITVTPEKAFDSQDNYIPAKSENDFMITKKALEVKLKDSDMKFLEGLIIRTLPNEDSKKSRQYMKQHPPFFSIEGMEYILKLNIKHLLIDIPSVDRTFDEGKLTAHHIFWDVPFGSHDVDKEKHSMRTITEMIYASNDIEDGRYLINIQIPDFVADAAPSRILLYKIGIKN